MKTLKKRPNILILCTDQQRSFQHFPKGWVEKNLPWTTHLQNTGITYKNNMCSSTACSPSRSTIFSSTYPTINGVLKVNDTIQMSRTLPMGGSLITMGKMMSEAGYDMVYKGKWHLDASFAEFSCMRPSDLDRIMIEDDAMENHYDNPGWTSPDLGTGEYNGSHPYERKSNSALNSIGGGTAENDGRIVNGPMFSDTQQSAVNFLENYNPESGKPFCLVVSLANPHDIWVYPYTPESAGYTDEIWTTEAYDEFELPESYSSSLDNKPIAQAQFLSGFQGGPLDESNALNYVKFYAYLQTLIDDLTGDLIKALRSNVHVGNQLEQDTLIVRMSDHGEMGMAQGGMRQKENNCYKETINIPMIFSNPNLPQGETKDDFVSLIDLMPTLADIAEAKIPKNQIIQGQSYAQSILDGKPNGKPFNYFATDDGSLSEYTSIRAIIDSKYKYAVYYKVEYTSSKTAILNYNGVLDNSKVAVQFELYDYSTEDGRQEIVNILADTSDVSDEYQQVWDRLHRLLTKQMIDTFTCPDDWKTIFDS